MKIQLDTSNKTITVEEKVNLGELFDILSKLLPDDSWKQFDIVPMFIYNWSNPIVIQPYLPYTYPWITYADSSSATLTTDGIYNIEINK